MKITYQNNYKCHIQREKKLIIFNNFFYDKRVNLDEIRKRIKKIFFFKLYSCFLIYKFK